MKSFDHDWRLLILGYEVKEYRQSGDSGKQKQNSRALVLAIRGGHHENIKDLGPFWNMRPVFGVKKTGALRRR
ncbi:MAG: hypothetical protein HGB35_03020 [Geobacteraceae bacterium]|nr:hypothetical protein [Geobacteraceae bacterium]